MKRFGSLFLAAVLGSLCTLAAFQWLNKDEKGVRLEYTGGTPIANVAYSVDGDGQAVPLDFTKTAEMVTPAVVYIRSTQDGPRKQEAEDSNDPWREFFGPRIQPGPSQSAGSGVIINEKGYIVTNNHVVKDADVIEVTLSDNRTVKAEVMGTDPDTDLALIKINVEGLPHLSFVDSDKSK